MTTRPLHASATTTARLDGRLPDFLIGGAPKCGTTSLATALGRHPRVFIPARKELSFFHCEEFHRGLAAYAEHFRDAAAGQLAGEATPDYLGSALAAERIATALPGVRLVFVLRDPVARALSHFRFRVGAGREERPLARVLADEHAAPLAPASYVIRHSRYSEGLRRYHSLLGPERVHTIVFEELVAETREELAKLQRFLALEPQVDELPRENAGREARHVGALRMLQRLTRDQGPMKRLLRALVPEPQRRAMRALGLRALTGPADRPMGRDEASAALEAVLSNERAATEAALGRRVPAWHVTG